MIVDVDGVLANFTQGFTLQMRRLVPQAPVTAGPWEADEWDFREYYWPEIEDRSQLDSLIEAAWTEVHDSNVFWYQLPPLWSSHEVETLRNLRPALFMTRREGRDVFDQTYRWFLKYGIMEPMIMRVRSGEEKYELAKPLGQTVLIDDSPKNCQEAAEAGMYVVMLDYPYNRGVKHKNLTRVGSLGEALEVGHRLEGN